MEHKEDRVEAELKAISSLNYLVAVPEGYDPKGEALPLVLFLHGAGERGDNLARVKFHGPPRLIEQGKPLNAIVVSPQCPADTWWTDHIQLLSKLLDKIERDYTIDQDRIYVTGLSMGGYGTFALAAHEPKRFAAAVPICGGGSWLQARAMGKLPIWVFHGEADKVIPVDESRQLFNYIQRLGNDNAKLTVYPGVDHDSWTQTYANQDVWDWLFAQKRR